MTVYTIGHSNRTLDHFVTILRGFGIETLVDIRRFPRSRHNPKFDGETLVVHLGMSGQLLRAKTAREKAPKHTHVVITFTQGGELRFIDPRTFGEMFVTKADEVATLVPELAHLGFDPVDDVMSWTRFVALLADRHTQLKALLTDQKFVAGIGNIYADEILFAAGLRYARSSDSLSAQEVRRLYRGMIETLAEAIAGICLTDRRVLEARVMIEKLDVEPQASVGVEIERRRDD